MTKPATNSTNLSAQLIQCQSDLFTGHLVIASNSASLQWELVFFHGRLVAESGGFNPRSRWTRYIQQYSPQLAQQLMSDPQQDTLHQKLLHWFRTEHLTREQVCRVMTDSLRETLLDLLCWEQKEPSLSVHKHPVRQSSADLNVVFLKVDMILSQAQQHLAQWQELNVDFSPYDTPVVVDPFQLQQVTTPQTFKALSSLVNGQNSFYDLAHRLNQRIQKVVQSLVEPRFQGVIKTQTRFQYQGQLLQEAQLPVITYIDDETFAGQRMKYILRDISCQFVFVDNPTGALLELVQQKPSLIFLDLVMPHMSGYELCSRIRQMSQFKETPIIIVTNNDGIVDRTRAKIVGADGFISKPIETHDVYRYLQLYGILSSEKQELIAPVSKASFRVAYS